MTARGVLVGASWNRLVGLGGVATANLAREASDYVTWPFATLDEIAGPMAPGDCSGIAARSGGGKTVYLASCVARWVDAGVPTAVFPLETTAPRYLTEFACRRLDIFPGDVVSGRLPAGHPDVVRVSAEIDRLVLDETIAHNLSVMTHPHLTAELLQKGVRRAVAEIGARVVVIDHIDHLSYDGRRAGEFADVQRVAHAMLTIAQKEGIVIVYASQLNNSIYNPQDKLAKYRPPEEQHVRYGDIKRQISAGMFGLFRPLRRVGRTETDAEFIAKVKAARDPRGAAEPATVLDPGSMGLVMLKSRNYGSREGARMYLRFHNGRLEDFPLREERYSR